MKSAKHGSDISAPEVVHISKHGFWLFVNDRERFLPFEKFPWFRHATIDAILNVQLLHGSHLRWPELDVDLELDSIDRPDDYPLIHNPA